MQYYCVPSFVDRFEDVREVDGEWRRDFRMYAFAQIPTARIENLSELLVREELKRYFLDESRISWQPMRVDEGLFLILYDWMYVHTYGIWLLNSLFKVGKWSLEVNNF